MPADPIDGVSAPARNPGGDRARSGAVVAVDPRPGLWLVRLGAVGAVAVAWAAVRSGAAAAPLGRTLGRLDGGLAVLLVAGAAAAQFGVTGRALAGTDPPPARAAWRRRFRSTVLPWWLVSSVALFLYPVAGPDLVPGDGAAPTWVEVVREWFLVAPLVPADGAGAPAAAPGRLGHGWVVTTAVVAWLLLPAWERLLRRTPAATGRAGAVRVAVGAGAGAVALGLAVRVGVAALDPAGWGLVARFSPLAQLDLLGAGVVVGAVAAGARAGVGPAAGRERLAGRVGVPAAAAVALALVLGAASPAVGSVIDPGGPARTLAARVGLVAVAAALAGWGLLAPAARWWPPVAGWARSALGGAFLAVPLAAQLWGTRAGGPPGTQRVGPLVLATVAGVLLAGTALGRAGHRLFGPARERRFPPFVARLAALTGVALAWRLLTLVSINRRNPDGGDPFFYHHQANMLADRVGFSEPFRWVEMGLAVPSALHPPLLSTWLAAGSLAGARTFLAHKALAAVLGVGVVVVAGLIARRLAGDRAGLVAAALVAAYPNLWVIDGALWPEGVYTTLVGGAVLAALRWWDHPSVRRGAVLGGAVAVAALARGEALFLYPLLVAPLAVLRGGLSWGRRLRVVAAAGLCGLVVLAPWTVRNHRAFGELVLLSTNSDEVLYYANCPDSYGLPDEREGPGGAGGSSTQFLGYWSFNCQQRERDRAGQVPRTAEEEAVYASCLGDRFTGVIPGEPPGSEVDKARYWRCLGAHYASDHLDRLPRVVAARIGRELDLYRPGQGLLLLEIEGRPRAVARLGQVAWWVMAPVGLAGWVLLRRRGVLVYPLVALGLMVLATTVYAYGAVRFRTPLELGLLVGAGVAVDHVAGLLAARRGRGAGGAARAGEVGA